MDRNTPYSNRHRLRLIRDQLTTWGTTNNKVQVANNAELIPECERPLMQHLAQRNPFPNLQDPNDEESELNDRRFAKPPKRFRATRNRRE